MPQLVKQVEEHAQKLGGMAQRINELELQKNTLENELQSLQAQQRRLEDLSTKLFSTYFGESRKLSVED